MIVAIVFLVALFIAFGYMLVAYLDAAPIIDEDEQYAAYIAMAQEAHVDTWFGETP